MKKCCKQPSNISQMSHDDVKTVKFWREKEIWRAIFGEKPRQQDITSSPY